METDNGNGQRNEQVRDGQNPPHPRKRTDGPGARREHYLANTSATGVIVPAPASASTFGDLLASLLSDPARQAALRAGALGRAREMSVDAHVSRLTTILHGVIRQGVSP